MLTSTRKIDARLVGQGRGTVAEAYEEKQDPSPAPQRNLPKREGERSKVLGCVSKISAAVGVGKVEK